MDLISVMREVVSLTPTEVEAIRARVERITLRKGEIWLKKGVICSHIGFLQEGAMRIFYLNPEGKDVTCHFFQEGEYFASYNSFVGRLPARENLQALSDCVIDQLDRQSLIDLGTEISAVEQFMRYNGEKLMVDMEDRIRYLQNASAEKRYQYLMKTQPRLILHVPQQYIASYLGITPQHMSRLRRQFT